MHKFAEYELKGVPVRLAIGPRDLENHTVEIVRRDKLSKEIIQQDKVIEHIKALLVDIQQNIFQTALKRKKDNTYYVDDYEEFKQIVEGDGGFIYAHWDGTSETELKIKEETKATVRCIPVDTKPEKGKCIYTGKPSTQRVIFAKAY